MKRCGIMALSLSAAIGLAATPADAGIACTVRSAGLAFGVYNSLKPSATDAAGRVTVTCTGDPEPANQRILFLSGGGSGNALARRMLSGGNQLKYQIYTNAARTLIWGNGSNGTSSIALQVAVPASVSADFFGRVAARQAVALGSYIDTVVVTVNF